MSGHSIHKYNHTFIYTHIVFRRFLLWSRDILTHIGKHLHVQIGSRCCNTFKPSFLQQICRLLLHKKESQCPDILLENLNSYHPNIKFTVEENPDHFLDTAFTHQEGNFITKVHQNQGNYKYIGNRPSHISGNATLS